MHLKSLIAAVALGVGLAGTGMAAAEAQRAADRHAPRQCHPQGAELHRLTVTAGPHVSRRAGLPP
jgi:hypothetical protein